jgi:hypothetical protein
MSPLGQKGVERMTSRYIPPGPDGLLGARNVAVAEWKTETLESHIIGHTESVNWLGSMVDVGLNW